MFCTHCGQEIPDQSKFCISCGNMVEGAAPTQSAEPQRQTSDYSSQQTGQPYSSSQQGDPYGNVPQQKPSKVKEDKPYIIAGIVIFVILLSLFLLLNPSTKKLFSKQKRNQTHQSAAAEKATTTCIVCGKEIEAGETYCPECRMEESRNTSYTAEEQDKATVTPLPTSALTPSPSPSPIPELLTYDLSIGTRLKKYPIYSQLSVTRWEQSSVVTQSGNHDNTANASVDGKLETSWQEGTEGAGIGEYLLYNLDGEHDLHSMCLYLGNWNPSTPSKFPSSDWFTLNNVPAQLTFNFDNESITIDFPYEKEVIWVYFNKPVSTNTVMIVIDDVYKGTYYDDTCIAEVSFYGE